MYRKENISDFLMWCINEDKITFKDSIYNPDNTPYILECAFNLDKPAHLITQKEFNRRYTK